MSATVPVHLERRIGWWRETLGSVLVAAGMFGGMLLLLVAVVLLGGPNAIPLPPQVSPGLLGRTALGVALLIFVAPLGLLFARRWRYGECAITREGVRFVDPSGREKRFVPHNQIDRRVVVRHGVAIVPHHEGLALRWLDPLLIPTDDPDAAVAALDACLRGDVQELPDLDLRATYPPAVLRDLVLVIFAAALAPMLMAWLAFACSRVGDGLWPLGVVVGALPGLTGLLHAFNWLRVHGQRVVVREAELGFGAERIPWAHVERLAVSQGALAVESLGRRRLVWLGKHAADVKAQARVAVEDRLPAWAAEPARERRRRRTAYPFFAALLLLTATVVALGASGVGLRAAVETR